MRKNESQKVEKSLKDMGLKLHVIKAAHQFSEGFTTVRCESTGRCRDTPILCQTVFPEDKRMIIGDVFVKVAQDFVRELNLKYGPFLISNRTLSLVLWKFNVLLYLL